jgi:glycerol-3-phosphate dehydrogenase
VVCNYARVRSIDSDDHGCRLTVLDEIGGGQHTIAARAVVNAAGPWVEGLLPPTDDHAGPRLHLSKGVHLVVARARLDVQHMVMMAAPDGRPVFAISRGAVTYVGTTDTSHAGGARHWPEVEQADIDYLLGTANAHFRGVPLSAADVLATWAGLRPLIHQPGKSPKEMSRRDEVWRHRTLVTVAGGKLTGFRSMATQVMAEVGEVLGRRVTMTNPLAVLPGGDVDDVNALRRSAATRYQLDVPVTERLVRLYGSELFDVLGEHPTPLSESVFAEEVHWAVRVEGARTLEDVVYRRIRAAWFLPDELEALVPALATVLADELGWGDARREAEIARTRARLSAELDFRRGATLHRAASAESVRG